MKKILSMIMLCVISIMCFGENYYWEKVKLTSSEYHKDGEYIICYETPGNKIKVFQNFMTQAITINKTNDSNEKKRKSRRLTSTLFLLSVFFYYLKNMI